MASKNENYNNGRGNKMNAGETNKTLMEELELLRSGKLLNEKLLADGQLLRQKQEAMILKTTNDLARRIDELEKANLEIYNARRAALNLMEDALLSKEALLKNEERLRVTVETAIDFAIINTNTKGIIEGWNS